MSQDSLISKLEELDRLFTDIGKKMEDPAIASDPQKIVQLSTEHSQLSRIVNPYREYKKLVDDSEQAQMILDDPESDADMRGLANAELDDLRPQIEEALEVVKGLLVMSDESQVDSVMLEIRAGTGGDEAALFAGDLLNMYQQYAAAQGWKLEVLSASPTELGGFKEVVATVKGPDVWARMGYEGGGHRVQRVPKTESQGRIHTSAATVAVLPEPKNVEVNIDWDKDVIEHTMRASGPGGQNVNKVESAIKLEHIETGITVSMRDEKSQHKNRAKGRRILAIRVNEHYMQKQLQAEGDARKKMIGSGDRSQRIRTYNFPQNRCTDHRLKGDGAEGANYNLDRVLNGDMDDLVDALIAHDKAQRLANL
jgi:peptide chain release factor 1